MTVRNSTVENFIFNGRTVIFAVVMVVAANALLPSATDDFQIGDRVVVGGVKPGIIAFIGEVHFGTGDWAGVVLDTPTGKNDGTFNGRQYFMCPPKRGVFCRLGKLTKQADYGTPGMSVDSGAISQLQRTDSPSPLTSAAVTSSSSKAADSKPPTIVVEKPSSLYQSAVTQRPDQGITTPPTEAESTNHSEGDDHVIARLLYSSLLSL